MHRPLTSGAFILSMIVMALFGADILGFAPGLNPASEKLLELSVTLVMGYWLGSSAGSAAKEAKLNPQVTQ